MIINADAIDGLRTLEAGSVRCCVTSPPYWGLRDYGHDGQIGLEETPEAYVARLVDVFREVRRALADDGTLWLNLGDSYAAGGGVDRRSGRTTKQGGEFPQQGRSPVTAGLKPKDLVGIPWIVAFALRADGWYLRSDIIWRKPNPMPESVRDRCTSAHEYVFMLSKSRRYYWDQDAVREEGNPDSARASKRAKRPWSDHKQGGAAVASYNNALCRGRSVGIPEGGRNLRDVWTIATQPYPGAHFAVMPPALVEPCIKAGSAMGDTVLDPFAGAGTVGMVARRLRRSFVGVELNPKFAAMARRRIEDDAPMFNRGTL